MLQNKFEEIAKCFEKWSEVSFGEFCDFVDDSPYTANDWITALQIIDRHLASEQKKLDLKSACGYLACISEDAASAAFIVPLEEIVQQMIEDHGIERATKRVEIKT